MSTDISPQNEQYLQEAIARGSFQSRGQALDVAIELLRRREAIIREVKVGIDELERGEGRPLDITKMKAEIRQTLAEDADEGVVHRERLSDEEFEAALDELADVGAQYNLPSLPDRSITREGIYGDHF
jgi:Arc/MetJ-type ribon-helix-helix transcriptional regulator